MRIEVIQDSQRQKIRQELRRELRAAGIPDALSMRFAYGQLHRTRPDLAERVLQFVGIRAPRSHTTNVSCAACGGGLPDTFMLRDDIWRTIAGPHTILCWRCAEDLLGRCIQASDLNDAPCNAEWRRWLTSKGA